MKRLTEGVLNGDRQERVIESVLRATAETLARSGYAGLRFEEVAALSGVNKTTIYRRWPTKPELVAAALEAFPFRKEPRDTGCLRDDLIEAMRMYVRYVQTPMGRGIVRIMQAERSDPEVDKIAREQKRRQRATMVPLIERAVGRGDLPATADAEFVNELIFGPLFTRLITWGDRPDEAFIVEIVETVLAGVRARASARRS
jgi:AcrR family transcriptional regulator